MLGDNLLRMVFGPQGIYYAPLGDKHHARSCTFGTIHVNWRNAFTQRGLKLKREKQNKLLFIFLVNCKFVKLLVYLLVVQHFLMRRTSL